LVPPELIIRRLGKFGHRLMELAQGKDDAAVVPHSPAKSISSEITLDQDTRDRKTLAAHLLNQAQSVARQLRRHKVRTRTITLKIKTADFKLHTRSRTLDNPFQDSETIFKAGESLLDAFGLRMPVRLIGLGAGNLTAEDLPIQTALFGQPEDELRLKWRRIDTAVDAISARYGGHFVGRAATKTDSPDKADKEKDG
jgi:DNA polymerase-4